MSRLLDLTNAAGCCGLAFVAYKLFELGPYEAAVLLGRSFRIFVAAALGSL